MDTSLYVDEKTRSVVAIHTTITNCILTSRFFASPRLCEIEHMQEKSSDVCVCMLAHGNYRYLRSARRAALSVLKRTDLDLFLAASRHLGLPVSRRIQFERIEDLPPD